MVAGWTALASGVLAAIGVVFLALMFASFAAGSTSTGQTFGRINDVLILVSYALATPSVLAVHALLRTHAPVASGVLAIVGVSAIVAIVVLQAMLVTGVLTFEEQVGPVSVALLILGGWFVVTGRMATSAGLVKHGVRMGVLAAAYVGYPIWAIWIGRRFLAMTTDRQLAPGLAVED
jgi:hypothetical protein